MSIKNPLEIVYSSAQKKKRWNTKLVTTLGSIGIAGMRMKRSLIATTIATTLAIAAALATAQSVGQEPPKPQSQTKRAVTTQTCALGIEGVLKCPRFGFTYKTIFGWVDRTDEMQPDADAGKSQTAAPNHSETLLAMFERPPGAPGDTINSAVVIVAESMADYHGIKTAADYFGPIMELNEQRGFKVEHEPYASSIGTRKLVRGDFSKDRDRGKVTMWQSSLVMIEKGYIVSFTFVGGSEEEVASMIGNLSFRMPPRPGPITF